MGLATMDEIKKTGLLSLPLELLKQIADDAVDLQSQLEFPWSWYHTGRNFPAARYRRECRKISRNLRLTCKRLHEAASHTLVPLLEVRLDKASLVRANRLSSVPGIAAGIREILVVLNCCPNDVAADLELFRRFRSSELD